MRLPLCVMFQYWGYHQRGIDSIMVQNSFHMQMKHCGLI